MKIFLGGTCNESKWREAFIPHLTVDYFNPVVKDWNEECQAREIQERKDCKVCMYTITPKMTGVYSIAEVVDDSNKRPGKTMLIIILEDGEDRFTKHQIKSLNQVCKMVKNNGGYAGVITNFDELKMVADTMNIAHLI